MTDSHRSNQSRSDPHIQFLPHCGSLEKNQGETPIIYGFPPMALIQALSESEVFGPLVYGQASQETAKRGKKVN